MLLSGLDIVRRDWSQFAADAGKAVIDIIMTDKAQDTRLAEIQVPVHEFMTMLSAPPSPFPPPLSLLSCREDGQK